MAVELQALHYLPNSCDHTYHIWTTPLLVHYVVWYFPLNEKIPCIAGTPPSSPWFILRVGDVGGVTGGAFRIRIEMFSLPYSMHIVCSSPPAMFLACNQQLSLELA